MGFGIRQRPVDRRNTEAQADFRQRVANDQLNLFGQKNFCVLTFKGFWIEDKIHPLLLAAHHIKAVSANGNYSTRNGILILKSIEMDEIHARQSSPQDCIAVTRAVAQSYYETNILNFGNRDCVFRGADYLAKNYEDYLCNVKDLVTKLPQWV